MVEAVVFDLDGTLLNTLEDLKEALNYCLEAYGYNPVSLEDTRRYIGNGIRNLILAACKEEKNVDAMFDKFKEYYTIHCDDFTKPYDGIVELINKLKKMNIPLGVVSNKAIYALDILVNNHFNDDFKAIIGDGMGYLRKPSPEPILECCKKLNVNPKNIIYVGDSDVDVKTIKNTGCMGIVVSYGFRSKDLLIASGAMNICDTSEEIFNTICKLQKIN